jgi:uncharacterized membrane protein
MQPPQNPYGAPNPYESGQPAGYNPAPTPSRGVSMDVIGEAWKLVQSNLGTWIGATAVMLIISAVFYGLNSRLGITYTTIPGTPLPDGTSTTSIPMPSIGPMYYVLTLINGIIMTFLSGGMMRMAINQTRTGKVEFSELFSAGDVIVNLLIAVVITYILTAIGLVLCIIPGLILMALLAMTTPLIVDARKSGIEAIGESINLVKPHLGGMIVLGIVLVLIVGVSAIPCGLGLLVSYPLAFTAIALVYRDLTGGTSNYPQTGYGDPNAPIASPR